MPGVVQLQLTAEGVGEGTDDGEPQAGALLAGAEHAVEGVEDAAAFVGGDAGAVVFDADENPAVAGLGPEVDLAAFGGVAGWRCRRGCAAGCRD